MPLALTCGGCDVGKPEPLRAPGPDVHVVGMFPRDGCGTGLLEACTVPTNATITIRFDRFLDPATVNRQAISVYTGERGLGSPTYEVVYDPVERVAEFRLGGNRPYEPNKLYQYELVVPKEPGDYGIRAFDGAPLAEADIPLRGSFVISDEPEVVQPPPPAPSCDLIVSDVFRKLGRCAGSECHRRGNNQTLDTMADLGDAPHQLYLDSPATFTLSAYDRVARQTDLGDFSGGNPQDRSDAVVYVDQNGSRTVVSPGVRFGVRMALVAPSSPGASYLLYKLLIGRDNYQDCSTPTESELCSLPGPCETAHPSLPLPKGECLEPPEDELTRLREWFVRGAPMPRADSSGQRGNVRLQGLRALAQFIAAGATCED
ncbi:MAG: hypothetical protein EOO73_33820 [Myxococcales bacterium]|nr:MAG: hypothetical protein EOO73_33820 [Myxococcales bacterium]